MTATRLQVDIVSDVMCPWCYVGKRRLEKAVADSDIELDIKWRPFQLDHTLPPEGKDRKQYLAEKFGSAERAKDLYSNIKAAGAEEGIPFAFDLIEVSPNTLDPHRLIRWAGGMSTQMQGKIVEALFAAYFLEGRNIGDHAVLKEIAEAAGMDGALVSEQLESDSDREKVAEEVALAQRMGVTGVPTFIVENKYALIGAQPAETLRDAFAQIAAEKDAA